MKKHRNKNTGKFISHAEHMRNSLRFAKVFTAAIVCAILLGSLSTYVRYTEAKNTMTDEQLCSLIAVVCDGEEIPSETQALEVGTAPKNITPSEVALWYTDSNTKLLEIVINGGDLEALEDHLNSQHAYARAVMIATGE